MSGFVGSVGTISMSAMYFVKITPGPSGVESARMRTAVHVIVFVTVESVVELLLLTALSASTSARSAFMRSANVFIL